MAVAHGETRQRAPALTIGARVVPMIDAARAAEHADLMPVTKSPTEPGGRLASYVALHRVGHKREVGIAAFFNHLRTSDTQLVILSSASRRNDRGVDLPGNVAAE